MIFTRVVTATAMAAGLLAGASAPAAAEPEPSAPDRPARVLSFNIHHGVGLDDRLDLERIAREIEDEDVEIAGLQEVDRHFSARSDFVDQARWLARRLRMNVVYGANLSYDPLNPGEPRREYGTAVLSRFPIAEWSNTFLPKRANSEQRGLLYARVLVRGVPVRIYNTHLQHNSQMERMWQIDRIRELIGTPDESVILVGDLNADPEDREIKRITKDLVDTWLEAGVGPGYTYDAESPHARIDYVLSSDDVVARTAAVIASESSDHRPLLVDVALPGSHVGVGR